MIGIINELQNSFVIHMAFLTMQFTFILNKYVLRRKKNFRIFSSVRRECWKQHAAVNKIDSIWINYNILWIFYHFAHWQILSRFRWEGRRDNYIQIKSRRNKKYKHEKMNEYNASCFERNIGHSWKLVGNFGIYKVDQNWWESCLAKTVPLYTVINLKEYTFATWIVC